MYQYKAFGLFIEADLEIPELLTADFPSESRDLLIQTHSVAWPETLGSNVFLATHPSEAFYEAEDVARFYIHDGRTIFYEKLSEETRPFRLFLLGSCMGIVLQQRGYIVLHGNAITTDQATCTVFVGHSGAGKSTTAAWFYQQGADILADDVCAVSFDQDGQAYVIPSYPQLKLWEDSAALLKIDTQPLKRIRSDYPKYALPIPDRHYTSPLPIAKIVEIQKDSHEVAEATGLQKLKMLTEHSYRFPFIAQMKRTNEYLKNLVRLAHNTPIETRGRLF